MDPYIILHQMFLEVYTSSQKMNKLKLPKGSGSYSIYPPAHIMGVKRTKSESPLTALFSYLNIESFQVRHMYDRICLWRPRSIFALLAYVSH